MEREVKEALQRLGKTSPGLDKITREQLKGVDVKEVLVLFNTMYAASHTPKWLQRGRVTLAPRNPNPLDQRNFDLLR